MFALLKKEIASFLSSLIGYVVICVFLLVVSLFLWVFVDTDMNIIDNGYASLDPLFYIAPWVFMFLIPAITMRSFAEEKKAGTIEVLLTRPITDMQIVFAKYLAGLILVVFALLPTVIYIISIYQLAVPVGNIDFGGLWGSYIGLVFLASAFVAIGIFSSSISDNQIVSFILAVFLCFIWHVGFQSLGSLAIVGSADTLIMSFGINAHYNAMSRGVIDSRDVLYFISLVAAFLLLSRTVLESRKW